MCGKRDKENEGQKIENEFPEVIKLKQQLSEFKEMAEKHNKEIYRIKGILANTSKNEIQLSYKNKKISEPDYNKLMEDYERCEAFVFYSPQMDEATQKIIYQLELQLEEYRDKWRRIHKNNG